MINRMPLLIVFLLFIATAYGLFFIKEKVVYMRSELYEVKRQINNERDSIHILRAEFAYLSDPKRLSRLNNNYLQLSAASINQIVSSIDDENIDSVNTYSNNRKILSASAVSRNVKWRYKKGPDKYMTRVVGKN